MYKPTVLALLAAAGLMMTACEEKPADKLSEAAKAAGDAASKGAAAVSDAANKGAAAVSDAASKGVEAAKDAVSSALSAETKAAASSYLDELKKATGVLEGIKTPADATAKLSEIAGSAAKVNGFTSVLNALKGEDATALKTELKSQMEPVISGFKAQVDRLTKDTMIGTVIGDALKSFKLFE